MLSNIIKNYLKAFLYFFIPFIVLTTIITAFYYFDILSNQTIKYFKIIILLVSSFLGGFYIGKKSPSKGYLNGLILGSIIVFLFLIINLISGGFKWYHLVYYLILILVTVLSSMIGINRKK